MPADEKLLILNVIKIFWLAGAGFFIAFALSPVVSRILYGLKFWRKEARTMAMDNTPAPITAKLHPPREVPRGGGILIWGSVIIVALLFFFLSKISERPILDKLNFLSRSQTWLPLFTLVASSLLGLADDFMVVFGKGKYVGGGMRFTRRLILVIIIALVGAWWFHYRLGWHTIRVPFFGDFEIGVWYIPLFLGAMLATFGTSPVDGLDGLSGGVFASSFAAFMGIAFARGQIDLAAFIAVLVGTLLAFLWYNIPPARFFMGETGILGLTTTLTVVAFLTNSIVVLPIVAFIPFMTMISVAVQLGSKRFFGKKIFLAAPLHHHFEAIGWPSYKVTMRFWVVNAVMALIGMTIGLITLR
ncbi:hypothetical protein HYV98_01960 [Candidatus Azambacteria bacterium]|nr:hypothetical protein [Candidatus Azambacteria bacterium]